jgi:hypothetical protein
VARDVVWPKIVLLDEWVPVRRTSARKRGGLPSPITDRSSAVQGHVHRAARAHGRSVLAMPAILVAAMPRSHDAPARATTAGETIEKEKLHRENEFTKQ